MTGRVMATWFGPSKSAETVYAVTGGAGHADPNWIREKVEAILQEGTASLLGATRPGLPASHR